MLAEPVRKRVEMNAHQVPRLCKAGVVVKHGSDFMLEVRDDVPVPKPGESLVAHMITSLTYLKALGSFS